MVVADLNKTVLFKYFRVYNDVTLSIDTIVWSIQKHWKNKVG